MYNQPSKREIVYISIFMALFAAMIFYAYYASIQFIELPKANNTQTTLSESDLLAVNYFPMGALDYDN